LRALQMLRCQGGGRDGEKQRGKKRRDEA